MQIKRSHGAAGTNEVRFAPRSYQLVGFPDIVIPLQRQQFQRPIVQHLKSAHGRPFSLLHTAHSVAYRVELLRGIGKLLGRPLIPETSDHAFNQVTVLIAGANPPGTAECGIGCFHRYTPRVINT